MDTALVLRKKVTEPGPVEVVATLRTENNLQALKDSLLVELEKKRNDLEKLVGDNYRWNKLSDKQKELKNQEK